MPMWLECMNRTLVTWHRNAGCAAKCRMQGGWSNQHHKSPWRTASSWHSPHHKRWRSNWQVPFCSFQCSSSWKWKLHHRSQVCLWIISYPPLASFVTLGSVHHMSDSLFLLNLKCPVKSFTSWASLIDEKVVATVCLALVQNAIALLRVC